MLKGIYDISSMFILVIEIFIDVENWLLNVEPLMIDRNMTLQILLENLTERLTSFISKQKKKIYKSQNGCLQ